MPDHEDAQSCCIIIPARFDSQRFPGKPLVRLKGANGVERPLIEWTWRAAMAANVTRSILVATDDRRIADEVERFGGRSMLTPSECANGTERCAAVVEALPTRFDVIVNLQGDAPLTPPTVVRALVRRLEEHPGLQMATPAVSCGADTYRLLVEDQACGRVGGTTVVFNRDAQALYFSKSLIPHVPKDWPADPPPIFLHLGVYAYRPEALTTYAAQRPSMLEMLEGLEQLRFLDAGIPVGVVVCPVPTVTMVELNNPSDAPLIERELALGEY